MKPVFKTFLTRIEYQEKQTLGILDVYKGIDRIYTCKTLELPWKNNRRGVSCIPENSYWVRKGRAEESPSRNYDHFHVEDVPNRSWILWHSGNYHFHIEGCILCGQDHTDINQDGWLDVTRTRFTIDFLYDLLPDRFPLVIKGL